MYFGKSSSILILRSFRLLPSVVLSVTGIVGTNILRICHEKLECLDEEAKIPKQWNTAFLSVHNNSGVVADTVETMDRLSIRA
jgi:hypothetical protein